MTNTIKVIFLLLFISCQTDELSLFNAKNTVAWSTVEDFEILDMSILNSNKVVDRPVLAWRALLRLKLLAEDAVSYKYHCIYYRIPYKSEKGIIKVMETDGKCADPLTGRVFSQLNNIEQLKFFFHDGKGQSIDKKTLRPLTLYFHIKHEKTFKWPEYSFVNLKKGRLKKRYSNSAVKRKYTGFMIWPVREGRIDFTHRKAKISFLGKMKDDYSKGESVVCHKVDDNCHTIGKMDCDRCRYGHFEAAGSKCPDTNIKICGINRCGKRGWPACPRGKIVHKNQGCANGSKAGFCEPGLKTFCDENKILVCL
ncbi:MAG: hypothetical protein OXB84_07480 [Halobacteriovoraceae bacterium]|nr:hypothetical protein [Halobacteriovoraceae bacterium]